MSDTEADEMAARERRLPGRRNSKKAIGVRSHLDEGLIRTLDHRCRRQIMRLLDSSEDPVGQHDVVEALDLAGGNVNYHLRVLCERGLVAFAPVGKGGQARYVSRVEERATIRIFLEEQGHG